jgi:phospholipid/cholesterol/gamma-HCH transport system substrate-binding protein
MKNTLETRLGVFFALALIVSVIILEMIGAADFLKRGYQVSAYFKTAQELKKGDQVKLAGVEIGTVEDIQLITNRARVTMKIQEKYEIRTDSRAVIKFAGLMGQNFVSVEGGSDGAPRLLDGATLQTGEQPDLGVVMQKLQDVATGVEGLTKSFSPDNFSSLLAPIMDFVRQNSPPLTAMIGNLKTVSDQIAQGRGSVGRLINDDGFYTAAYSTVTNLQTTSADLKGMMKDVEGMIGKANSVIDQVKAGQGTVGKLVTDETLYRETAAAMEQLNQILGKINKGQGSVGQLVNDEAFLKNAKMSLQKLDKATDSLEDQGPLSVLGLVIGTLF